MGRKVPQGELADFGGFLFWSLNGEIAGTLTAFAGLAYGASMAGGPSCGADERTEFHNRSVDGAVVRVC